MSGINDFVIRFANVNGTGSASANFLFAKTLFRMGIPVSPKNIFPSNIQGLPTWYEVRVCDKGYLGRREGIDLMVCVNPQSLEKDVASVKDGGYFLYDSTKPLHTEFLRSDIHYLPVPLMSLCNENFTDARQKQLFKNMVYVGALAVLLNLDFEVIAQLVGEQFKGKEKLIQPNILALNLGADYVRKHFDFPLSFHAEKRNLTHGKIMIDGNTAAALGALYGGATVVPWYPITPSTSLVDAFTEYAEQYRVDPETGRKNFAVIQAEDELAAMGMVIGAMWNGARAFTATSGPGLSLMNEFLGLAYFAEIPAVLIDVQRAGPSTGMPTRTQQSDVLLAAYASHGDTKNVLLFPSTPDECFELTATAFDLAEDLQTPVIVMSDLDLGMNDHISEPLHWQNGRTYNRGKVLSAEELEQTKGWGRYLDVDHDGVPYRTIPGTHPQKGSYFTRGSSHDEYSRYTEDADTYVRIMDRLLLKFHKAATLVPEPEFYGDDVSAEFGIIYFGTTHHAAMEALDMLSAVDLTAYAMRLKAFPFSQKVRQFTERFDKIYVIEQNRDAQMRTLLINELEIHPERLIKVLNYDGTPITADLIVHKISSDIHSSTLIRS
ncbi:MAG: 2-oxoacid:acceptor oxidoreductase subunit alpha [Saprospiraceae bacterium]|nr:2-oxoacid:acceptor oxidoreductase subunit alpha [Saprospiraceae bacterium]